MIFKKDTRIRGLGAFVSAAMIVAPNFASAAYAQTSELTLNFVKSAGNSRIYAGELALYTYTLENVTDTTASDVVIDDQLPGGLVWTDDSSACSITGADLHCDVGNLGPGASFGVTVGASTIGGECTDLHSVALATSSTHGQASDGATVTVACPVVDGNLGDEYQGAAIAWPQDPGGNTLGRITVIETSDAYYVGFQQPLEVKSNDYCERSGARPGCYQALPNLVASDYFAFEWMVGARSIYVPLDILRTDASAPSGYASFVGGGDGGSLSGIGAEAVQGKSSLDFNLNPMGWSNLETSPNYTDTPHHPYVYPSVAEIRLDKAAGSLPNGLHFELASTVSMDVHNSPWQSDPTPTQASGGRFTALVPQRIHDTRQTNTPLGPGETTDIQVTGQGGVPATDVSAVSLNVTVTEPTHHSFLSVWPSGDAWPGTSNLNFAPGQTVPNHVTVEVGDNGRISVYNPSGTVHFIIDVAGWYGTDPWGASGRVAALKPYRLLDTRDGPTPLTPGEVRTVQVTGTGGATGVPDRAAAVILNVTVTEPTDHAFVSIWPAGEPWPGVSNLNFSPGQTIPNRVIVRLGSGGALSIMNSSGNTHLVIDVNAWLTDDSTTGGDGSLEAVPPFRILDTRPDFPLGAGEIRKVKVTGSGGIPATGVSAILMNVTVTEPTASSFLSVWPGDTTWPGVSDLNYTAGLTVPNLVVVKVDSNGDVNMLNAEGTAHVIYDVVGWYS